MGFRAFLSATGIFVGTTIGAGVFALPYLFERAGWLVGIGYLLGVGIVLSVSHELYARVIRSAPRPEHLIGFTRDALGQTGKPFAIVAVLGGLFLPLVAYLLLASIFAGLVVPGVSSHAATVIFWVLGSAPLVLRARLLSVAELLGAVVMLVVIGGIGLFGFASPGFSSRPAFDALHALEPFGAVLFSLAAWTAIPVMAARTRADLRRPIWIGTAVVVAAYAGFVLGVWGLSSVSSPDTISGLGDIPHAAVATLGILGLFALWTSYAPIAIEMERTMTQDLRMRAPIARFLVGVFPLAPVFLGVNSFLAVISLAGGVFVAAQYALIMLVARHALRLRGAEAFFTNLVTAAFVFATLYEIYTFVLG